MKLNECMLKCFDDGYIKRINSIAFLNAVMKALEKRLKQIRIINNLL